MNQFNLGGWICRDREDMNIEIEALINPNDPKVYVWGTISARRI